MKESWTDSKADQPRPEVKEPFDFVVKIFKRIGLTTKLTNPLKESWTDSKADQPRPEVKEPFDFVVKRFKRIGLTIKVDQSFEESVGLAGKADQP